ncbi:Lipase_3 domain-containing protein [Cephalotus follicularis]|uniref:Lipase_3 domain-containing protein n=1 Tax=Cephalotus follicularis TaxID=3775 RepID=A0A1Q3BS57_CEPFO|nr:Lipase_3 domain-containing protein [Cephalotus follicularis]
MACNSVTITTSPTTTATKNIFEEHNGLRRSRSSKDICKGAGMQRSFSSKALCNRASIRRSLSDNHLCNASSSICASSTQPKLKSSRSGGIFPFQLSSSMIPQSLRSFLLDLETSKDMSIVEDTMNIIENTQESGVKEVQRANWIARLWQIRNQSKNRQLREMADGDEFCVKDQNDCDCNDDECGCIVHYDSEGGGKGEASYEHKSFSRLLARVPWTDTKLFSQLAFLCSMAYGITEIKAIDLRRYYGLKFVTSSLEKKAEAASIRKKLDEDSTCIPIAAPYDATDSERKRPLRSSVAYEIAASAASYIQSHAKNLLSLGSESQQEGNGADSHASGPKAQEEGESSPLVHKSEVAAYVAASTMTAVVAAGEKEKQETARDLQSLHSSPCEWFVCDDASTHTRCFVIQGSDSLASWQANLFFEPTKFEGTDVLVHRGIYEAAKGIYEQFTPEIMDHMHEHGEHAKFQFTGHSLGGSLSLLVNLMLLTRKVVKPSALDPVVTFGSPFVFCGGQKILDDLGLDESHVHCVMMHRDIVPRAFSCNYPNHVAELLKRLNGPLRSHPCLIKKKFLYSPLGKIFILQPNEKSSPPHPLLPPGNALYTLDKTQCGYSPSALRAFLNCPHPLETLSDPTAYGSEGTILRDHDSSNYLKAVNGVLRQHTKMEVRKVRKQRNLLWPLLTSPSPHSCSHESNLNRSRLVTKEVMTGV